MSKLPRQTRLACNFSRPICSINPEGKIAAGIDDEKLQTSRSDFQNASIPKSGMPRHNNSVATSNSFTINLVKESDKINVPSSSSEVECVPDAGRNGQKNNSNLDGARGPVSNQTETWATWNKGNVSTSEEIEAHKQENDNFRPKLPHCLPESKLCIPYHSDNDGSNVKASKKTQGSMEGDRPLINLLGTKSCHVAEPPVLGSALPISKHDANFPFKRSQSSSFVPTFLDSPDQNQGTPFGTVATTTDSQGAPQTDTSLKTDQQGCNYAPFQTLDLLKDFRSSMTSRTAGSHELMSGSSTDSSLGLGGNPSRPSDIPPKFQDEVKNVLTHSRDVVKYGAASKTCLTNSDIGDAIEHDDGLVDQMKGLDLHSPGNHFHQHASSQLVNENGIEQWKDTRETSSAASELPTCEDDYSSLQIEMDNSNHGYSSISATPSPASTTESLHGRNGHSADTSPTSVGKTSEQDGHTPTLTETETNSNMVADISQDGSQEDLIDFVSMPSLENTVQPGNVTRANSTVKDESMLSFGEGNLPFKRYLHGPGLQTSQTISTNSVTLEDMPDDDSFHGEKSIIPIADEQEIRSWIGSLTEVKKSSLVLCQGDDTVLKAVENSKHGVMPFKSDRKDMAIAISNSRDVQAVGNFHYNKNTFKVSDSGSTRNIKSQIKRELADSKGIFVKTKAYNAVENVLETEQMLFITGPSGVGKKMIALELLRQYERNGFEALVLKNVNEMRQMVNMDTDQAILMRNIFGTFEFDQKKFDDFVEYFDTIESCADETKKFIFTSKGNVFERGIAWLSTTKIFKKHLVVDLLQLDVLSPLEKRSIICHHLKDVNVELPDDLVEKIVECATTHVFPKYCQIFSKNPQLHNASCALDFFQRPVLYHKGIINSMVQRDDKKPFAVLLLTMAFGQLSASFLDELDSPHEDQACQLLSVFGCGDIGSKAALRLVAESMLGTHLKRLGESFVFNDECLYDAVACVLGLKYPKLLLGICSIEFLCERINVDKEQAANSGDEKITLEEDQFDFLSERLVHELRKGNVYSVSSHFAFTHAPFVKSFVRYCESQDDYKSVIYSKDKLYCYSFLYWSSWNPGKHLFRWTCKEWKKIGISSKVMITIVKACCISGNVEVLQMVFQNILSKRRVSEMVNSCDRTPLPMPPCRTTCRRNSELARGIVHIGALIHTACYHGHLPIVKFLVVQSRSPVDVADSYGQLPINIAAREGHVDIVRFLLENGVKLNRVKPNKNTVMHDACEAGQTQVVDVLLEAYPKLLHVEGEEPKLRYPIHLATLSREPRLVQNLLLKGAKPELMDSCQNTAFHTACMKGGNLQTLKALKPSLEEINMVNKRNKTCLHLACKFGGAAMVQFLLSKGANVNAKDYMQRTPLHVACEKNKFKILEKLLAREETDLFLLDLQGKPALMLTTNKGIQKLLKDCMSKKVKCGWMLTP